MSVDLEKLARLANNASPLPWRYQEDEAFLGANLYEIRRPGGGSVAEFVSQKDAEFIVEVCNALLVLIKGILKLKSEIVELESELEFYREEKQLEWERSRDDRA